MHGLTGGSWKRSLRLPRQLPTLLLVSCAGLVPVLRLAERAGLHGAAVRRVHLPVRAGSGAANRGVKITSIVVGMVAGADSIDDLGVIRHGALPRLFGGIRAPSTLGTFLRGFTWGNVRQLDAVARETLTGLSRQAPLLPGADSYAFLDVDSTINRVYGYAKQGADYGYTRVRGLHPLLATLSTPIAAPVIAGTRLRRGSAGSARGAASFVAESIRATGVLLARMDSAFDSHAVVSTCIRPRGPLLDHHQTDPPGPGRDRRYQPGRLGSDRLPVRDRRRGQRAVDLRC
jgi:Transposase DDE domain group 1